MTKPANIPVAPRGRQDVPGALTPRQLRFAEHYVDCLNASEAARRSGYSKKTAAFQGAWLLKQPHIAQAIQELIFAQAPLLQARVLDETANIALANAADYFEWGPTEVVQEVLDDGTTVIRQKSTVTLKPSRELNRRQTAAIKRIVERTGADGTQRVEVEMHSKDASLDRLARLLGMLGSAETNININTAPVAAVSVSYADDPQTLEGDATEVPDNDR